MDVFIWAIPFFWHFQRFAGHHWGKEAFKAAVQLHQISPCMICFLFGKPFPPGWIAVNLEGISSFISEPRECPSPWAGQEKAFPQESAWLWLCFTGALLGILHPGSVISLILHPVSVTSQFAFFYQRENFIHLPKLGCAISRDIFHSNVSPKAGLSKWIWAWGRH